MSCNYIFELTYFLLWNRKEGSLLFKYFYIKIKNKIFLPNFLFSKGSFLCYSRSNEIPGGVEDEQMDEWIYCSQRRDVEFRLRSFHDTSAVLRVRHQRERS